MNQKNVAKFFQFPITSESESRRARILNALLLILVVATILGVFISMLAQVLGFITEPTETLLTTTYLPSLVFVIGLGIIYLINRFLSLPAGVWGFLALFTAIIYMSNTPYESIWGQNALLFALPVLLGSLLLNPNASFIYTFLLSLFLIVASLTTDNAVNFINILAYFVLAFISWLASRGLQDAIERLQGINQELDQRVHERTQDLSKALAREHAEASRTQTILSSIGEGIIVFDKNKEAIIANPASSNLLDKPIDHIVGVGIQTLMGTAVGEAEQGQIIEALHQETGLDATLKIGWDERTLSISFAPIQAVVPDANISGVVAVLRDFTKEAEIDRMKSDFVSIAAHELRTPLTAIISYLDVLEIGLGGELNEKQLQMVGVVRRNSDRLNEMVADLLDLSRIEAGHIELRLEAFAIEKIISTAVVDLQKQFTDRELTLAVDVSPKLPPVWADHHRTTQILFNLLSNAYKYTPRGGATLRARHIDNMVQIDIVDTGIGMSPEELEKLFSRFFRSDSQSVRDQPGTGLGLSITQSLIELQGGRIWVESEIDKGTTFSFTLPIAKTPVQDVSQAEKMGAETAVSSSTPPRPKIMVVDDDIETARAIQHDLEQADYEVIVVTNSHQVLPQARTHRPDLITLDLIMGIVDGVVILEKLKANPETAPIPVVILSAIHQPDTGVAIDGAAGHLNKSASKQEILQTLQEVLETTTSKPTVLVVDDEKDTSNWIKQLLTEQGFTVLQAFNGQEALDQVKEIKPDLILMDLMMPKMDGRTAIQHLRLDHQTSHIPIVVLSANPPPHEEQKQMLQDGVKHIIGKPVSVADLVQQVKTFLVT